MKVTDSSFKKQIAELRNTIYLGNVSEGVAIIMDLLQASQADEDRLELFLELVLLSLTCNDLEEAKEHWAQACDCHHANQNTRFKGYQAFFEFMQGRKKHALTTLANVIEENPNDFEFHLLRALVYIQCNQLEHAQADLVRASTLSPDNILVMSILADIHIELNDIDVAMGMHEKVLLASPDFRRSLMSLGVIYFEKQRLEDAFRLFQCLVAYDPMNWFAWTCLGDIRIFEEGKTFQALQYYAAAVVTGTEAASAYQNLAKGLMALGKFDQAVHVLNLYTQNPSHKWQDDELFSARYLTLIADVAKTPEFIQTPEFQKRFKQLKPCCDEAGKLLFKLLSTLASLSYKDDIDVIFTRHFQCFILMAQYLNICTHRIIYPDEATMYGILARYMIWHGMHFETQALLKLLSHADDPRVKDMIAIINNEIVKHLEVEDQAGMSLNALHSELIRIPLFDELVDRIMAGDIIPPPDRKMFAQALEIALNNPNHIDLQLTFFNPPSLTQIQIFNTALDLLVPPEAQPELVNTFWFDYDLWNAWYDMHKEIPFDEAWEIGKTQLSSDDTTLSYLRNLAALQDPQYKAIDNANLPPKAVDQFSEALKTLVNPKQRQIARLEIHAENSDTTQVCAASPDEALGGFSPMPFALDGTAFSRFMKSARFKTERLNDKNCTQYLHEWVRSQFVTQISKTFKASKTAKTAPEEKSIKQIEKFWKGLHGNTKLKESLFNAMTNQTMKILNMCMPEHSFLKQINMMSEYYGFPFEGIQLPKAPLYASSILIGHQEFPAILKDAELLKRPIPANFITSHNLKEFFFNYAVMTIEQWRESKNHALLEIFLDKNALGFVKFDALNKIHTNILDSQGSRTMQVLQDIHEPDAFDPHSSYSSNDLITSTQSMAQSLESFFKWEEDPNNSNNTHLPFMKKEHMFTVQFVLWAAHKAQNLYPEISQIEADVRSVTPATLYSVTWKLRDLINRFPWLSRLYVLLASAYARTDNYEEALKSIESGLEHEHRLYQNVGWHAITSDKAQNEEKLAAVDALNELEESQLLLWRERYVFQPRDEAMYHYAAYQDGYRLRKQRSFENRSLYRNCKQDKGGAFEFYQLFKRFIPRVANLRDAFCSALATDNVVSLRDFMVHVIIQMIAPETFPLRRQIAELLFALYPQENTGALGRFYCDNMQPANALPKAAYAYFAEWAQNQDDETQSSVTLGCLLYDMGYMDAAMPYLDRAVNVKNPSPMAFLTRGCALIENNELDKAVECLKAGLVIDPSSDRFYYNLTLAYIEQNKLDEAEQTVKAGIQLSKYPVDLNLQLMRIYVRKNKFVEALPLAKYVAKEDPDLFINAMKFSEFDEFAKLKPVKAILAEYNIDPNTF